MKKKFYTLMLLVGVLTIGSVNILSAQTFECQIVEDDFGYIVYQMRETSGTNTPTTSTVINDITFVIRYPEGAVTMSVLCTTNDYKIGDGLSGEENFDGYDYFYWNSDAGVGFNPPNDWTEDEWEDICKFKATGDTDSGLFTIAPDGWDGRGLNWNQTIGATATDFDPGIIGSGITYSYPTIVYDRVWVGGGAGFETDWWYPTNWVTECGGSGSQPSSANNVFIPDVSLASGSFPDANFLNTMVCNNLRIASGAYVSVPSTNGNLAISEELRTYGTLKVTPNANVTVSGNTYVEGAASIEVQATSAGIGSFIDNGTITYGGSGTAKVQTYLTGSGTPGTYDFHCVGPTVDITGTGVTLAEFNVVPGETYAYKYNEPTDAWVNYYSLSDAIPTAKGIGLSTNDGSTNTMEMTGELVTGNVLSEAMTIDLNGTYLLSNPYPSSVFWDDLYTNNGSRVNDVVYVYDGTNYQNYNTSTGGTNGFTGYLQVGQGFFVEATSASAFTFDNGDRHHSNSDFYKSSYTNRLDVRVSGNESTDGLLVHFYEGAISGYEPNEDAAKKMSYSQYATQFWTVLEDDQQMSINALPLELLVKGMQSIPMSFICSATGEYTMNFLDIESFDYGTEIWLEDKQVGGDWVSVNDNPDYIFTATPDDLEDRFIIHFFGPTGVDEFDIENTVDIFSYRQNAFVRNNTNEVINRVSIYTLSGELQQEINNVDLKLSKFWVSNNMGYYVVRVITDKNVYTNKVFISK